MPLCAWPPNTRNVPGATEGLCFKPELILACLLDTCGSWLRDHVIDSAGESQEGLSYLGKWHFAHRGQRPWGRNVPGLFSKRPACWCGWHRASWMDGSGRRGQAPASGGSRHGLPVCLSEVAQREDFKQRSSMIGLNVLKKTFSLLCREQTVRSERVGCREAVQRLFQLLFKRAKH